MRYHRYAIAFGASGTLHLLLALSLLWPASAGARIADRKTSVFIAALLDDPRFPGLHPSNKFEETPAPGRQPLHPLTLAGVRIDLKTIAARRHLLFPALTPGLALDSFFPNADSMALPREALRPSRATTQAVHGPLVLDDRGVQSIMDRTWARRGRWQAFQAIAKLMAAHAPGGSLPRVLRGYREQNALQPYADRDSRDPRLWTQLALAADHVSFIGFIRTYAASHVSTEEATELLLLLDTIVQAEQDALHVLLDTDPASELERTRASNRAAYALLLQVREEYRHELTTRGLISTTQIDAYYDNVRLAILRRVIDGASNGPAVEDARFLMGAILWRAGHRPEALSAWRELTPRPDGSYTATSAALLIAFTRTRVDDREVNRILENENGRWLSLSEDRLRHFGYRFDTY
jgi:hypothetical protein